MLFVVLLVPLSVMMMPVAKSMTLVSLLVINHFVIVSGAAVCCGILVHVFSTFESGMKPLLFFSVFLVAFQHLSVVVLFFRRSIDVVVVVSLGCLIRGSCRPSRHPCRQ
jgi:hypothetical protein